MYLPNVAMHKPLQNMALLYMRKADLQGTILWIGFFVVVARGFMF